METWHFLILLVIVNSAIWAYFDASRLRDEFHIGVGPDATPPHNWAAWIFLVWPVMLAKYVNARQQARLAERREGPPPRFETGGYTPFATVVGILGLLIFIVLMIQGTFKLATLGLVIAAAGLFGGRASSMTSETTQVDIGDVGFEQVGFQAPNVDDDADDEEMPADMVAYFSNLGRGTAKAERSDPSPAAAGHAAPMPAASPGPQPAAAARSRFDPAGQTHAPTGPAFGVVYSPPSLDAETDNATRAQAPAPPPAPASPLPQEPSLPLEEIVARAEALLPATRNKTPPASVADFQPLIPPEPSEIPARPIDAQTPASGSSKAYGYAAAAKPVRRPVPWAGILVALIIVGAASVAAWSYYQGKAEPPAGEPEVTATPTDDKPGARSSSIDRTDDAPNPADTDRDEDVSSDDFGMEVPEADESTEVDYALMAPWFDLYTEHMTALAVALDAVDYQGLNTENCGALQRQLEQAWEGLSPPVLDSAIDERLTEAFRIFDSALKACHAGKEDQWASSFVKGKAMTHHLQALMDERYQYSGVVTLEHEPLNGEKRPTISISGQYLAEWDTRSESNARGDRDNRG